MTCFGTFPTFARNMSNGTNCQKLTFNVSLTDIPEGKDFGVTRLSASERGALENCPSSTLRVLPLLRRLPA